jgi:hypothetical protein
VFLHDKIFHFAQVGEDGIIIALLARAGRRCIDHLKETIRSILNHSIVEHRQKEIAQK